MSAETTARLTQGNPLLRRLLALGFGLFFLVLLIWTFPLISDIVTLIVISVVISYALRPVVNFLEMHGINRIVSILVIFVVFSGLIGLAAAFIVPSLIQQLSDFGRTLNQLDFAKIQSNVVNWVSQYIPQARDMMSTEGGGQDMIFNRLRDLFASGLEKSANVLAGVLNAFTLLSMLPILVFFMLKDGRAFAHGFISRMPNRFFEMTLSLVYKINRAIGDYIVSVIISSLFIGILTWVGLLFIGTKYALALGVISALFNVIPFFGPLLTMLVVFAVVLLTESALFWPLIWTTALMFTLQQVESFVVKPMLLSHSLSIHPAAVILVVLIGGRFAGAIGMFIAIPVYSIIHMFIVDLYGHLKNYRII
ncbi:AI-2E family transporter [bacterium]|nr:AI-2E family transporter [bacterium]